MTRLIARGALVPAALVAAASLAGGCGGSSGDKATPTPAATAPADAAAAEQAIRSAYETFFSSRVPQAQRIGYLQDAGQLGAALGIAQKTAAAVGGQSAKVKTVTFTTANDATVTFELLIAGRPALPNATGFAVHEGGTWKVSRTTFCQLVALSTPGTPVPGCA